MPIILDNDEGQDVYLADDYTKVVGVEFGAAAIEFYTDKHKWVVRVDDGGRSRVFIDRSLPFVIRQVQEVFGGSKPRVLRNALEELVKHQPDLLDKIYKVL